MDRAELERFWRDSLVLSTLDELDTEATYRPARGYPWRAPEAGGAGFEVGEEIGRGGMGVVHRAVQTCFGRDVALKRVRFAEPGAREDFLSEAKINGRLEHPNIVPAYALDVDAAGEPFLALKLVGGRSWRQVLEAGETDLDEHLRILLQVCNAVEYAHSRGVIHNDLKPANVMLGAFGEVLLMDWGVAVSLDGATGRPHTAVTEPCGTPAYMPPELALGEGAKIGPATDTYLLGGLLYRLVSGHPPRRGGFPACVFEASQGHVEELSADVPPELRRICERALARIPAERFPDARSFRDALHAFLRHRESRTVSAAAAAEHAAARHKGEAELPPARRYEQFAAAIAGYGHALRLWPENPEARAGAQSAGEDYARAAISAGDLGLAEAQLERLAQPAPALREVLAAAAGRRTRAVRTRRLLGRGVIALTAVLLLLSTGSALVLWKANRDIAEERAAAEELGNIARDSFSQLAEEVQEKLIREYGDARSLAMAEEILVVASRGWERMAAIERRDDRIGQARSLFELAELQFLLGNRRASEQAALEVVALAREALAEAPENVDHRHQLQFALRVLGDIARDDHDWEAARAAYREALALAERRAAEIPDDPGARADVVTLRERETATLWEQGEHALAIERVRACVEERRALVSAFPGYGLRVLALSQGHLAEYLEAAGAPPREVARAWDEALAVSESLRVVSSYDDHQQAVDLAAALLGSALSREELGEMAVAERRLREAVALLEGARARAPNRDHSNRVLAIALFCLGTWHARHGEAEAAEEALRASVAIGRERVAIDAGTTATRLELLESVYRLGRFLAEQGRRDEAEACFVEVVAGAAALLEGGASPAAIASVRARARNGLGELREEGSQLREAAVCFAGACDDWRTVRDKHVGGPYNLAANLIDLARVRRMLGEHREALVASEEAAGLLLERADDGKTRAAALQAQGFFVREALACGEDARALEGRGPLLELLPLVSDAASRQVAYQALDGIARLLESKGDRQGARALYEVLLAYVEDDLSSAADADARHNVAIFCHRLADVLVTLDEASAALPLAERSLALRRELYAGQRSAQALLELHVSLFLLTEILLYENDPASARPLLEENIRLWRKMPADTAYSVWMHTQLVYRAAAVEASLGAWESAEQAFREAWELGREGLERFPDDPDLPVLLARICGQLAQVCLRLDRLLEARDAATDAVLFEELLWERYGDNLQRGRLAERLVLVARCACRGGDGDVALEALAEAAEHFRAVAAADANPEGWTGLRARLLADPDFADLGAQLEQALGP